VHHAQGDITTVSNTQKILTNASNSRPTISDLAEKLPASAEVDDQDTPKPLISFNPTSVPATSISRKGSKIVDKLDTSVLEVINQFLDNPRPDGQTNYNTFRREGRLYITEQDFPNLCDPEIWKLVREHLATALIGRGMHRYASDSSYSYNTGSFNIGGSRLELKADGSPQPYPSTLVLSICRFADDQQRARIKSSN